MTDKQPEALRLADALMKPVVLDKHMMQAATELRRLHEVNAELVKALQNMLHYVGNPWTISAEFAVFRAKVALTKA